MANYVPIGTYIPEDEQQLKEASGANDNVLTRSLRGGIYGAGSQLLSTGAGIADAAGADNIGAGLHARSGGLRGMAALPGNSPRVGSYGQLSKDFSMGNLAEYAGGLVGGSLPITAAGIAGGVATGGAGFIPAMLGAGAATLPFNMGEVVQKQQADPQAMQQGAGQRALEALAGGVGASAVESLVPGLVGRQVLGHGLANLSKETAKQMFRRNALDIPMEGLTEGTGTAIKQYAANQEKDLDWNEIKEGAIGGAAAGTVFSGVGTAADLTRGVGPKTGEILSNNLTSIKDGLRSAKDYAGQKMGGAKDAAGEQFDAAAATPAGKKVKSVFDDVAEMVGAGKSSAGEAIGKVMRGEELGIDPAEWARATTDEAKQRLLQMADSNAVKAATKWGKEMLDDVGLDAGKRQEVTDALANIGEVGGRMAMAGLRQGYDLAKKAGRQINRLNDSLQTRRHRASDARADSGVDANFVDDRETYPDGSWQSVDATENGMQDEARAAGEPSAPSAPKKSMNARREFIDRKMNEEGMSEDEARTAYIESLNSPRAETPEPPKYSMDDSGARELVMSVLTDSELSQKRPELFESESNRNETGAALLTLVDSMSRGQLSSEQLGNAISVFGEATSSLMTSVRKALSADSTPAETQTFFKNLNEIDAIRKRSNSLHDTMRRAFTEEAQRTESPGRIDDDARILIAHARGQFDGKSGSKPTEEQAYMNTQVNDFYAEKFGDKADLVRAAVEKEAGVGQNRRGKIGEAVDTEFDDQGNALEADDTSGENDADPMAPKFDENGSRLEKAEQDIVKYGLGPAYGPNKDKHHSAVGGSAMLEGSRYANQHLKDIRALYPDKDYNNHYTHDVRFERLPGSEYGHIVVEKLQDSGEFNAGDLANMALDTKNFSKSLSRINIGGHAIDAVKLAQVMRGKLEDKFEGDTPTTKRDRLIDGFKQGIAQLEIQFGKIDKDGNVTNVTNVSDEAVIGFIGGKPLTWGEVKAEERRGKKDTAEDRMSPSGKAKLAALRSEYQIATDVDRVEIAEEVHQLMQFEKDRELTADGDTQERSLPRAKAAVPGAQGRDASAIRTRSKARTEQWLGDSPRATSMRKQDRARARGDEATPYEDYNDSRYDREGMLTKEGARMMLEGDADGGIDIHNQYMSRDPRYAEREFVGPELADSRIADERRKKAPRVTPEYDNGMGRREVGLDENIHLVTAVNGDGTNGSGPGRTANMDGSGHYVQSRGVEGLNSLRMAALQWSNSEVKGARAVGDRTKTLILNAAVMSDADVRRLKSLAPESVKGQRDIPASSAGDAAKLINELARKYKEQIMAPDPRQAGPIKPERQTTYGEIPENPVKFDNEGKAATGAIRRPDRVAAKPKANASHADVQVNDHPSSGYSERTKFNADSADLTVAIAADFTTAGERLTRSVAGDRYKHFGFGDTRKDGQALASEMQRRGAASLNVAGNGIYTLASHGMNQAQVNQHVYDLLAEAHSIHPITKLVSGGQTGVDIAGAVAAKALGIPAVITLPRGFVQRNTAGRDLRLSSAEVTHQIESGASALKQRADWSDGGPLGSMPPAAKPKPKPKSLMSENIAKRNGYLDDQPADYSTEKTKGIIDWATTQKERVDAEVAKLDKQMDDPNFDDDRYDQLSDMQTELRLLAERAKKQVRDDKDMADADKRNGTNLFGGNPDPKPVAAKKAAFLSKVASGDKALVEELSTSTDAKGLQRALDLLNNHEFAGVADGSQTAGNIEDAYEAINNRMAELVQDPDVAYGMQTTKYSLEATAIHSDLERDGFAATHDSPIRHEGKFDWRAHQGKGEGNAAFGAGTYLSTSDGVHKNYKGQFTAAIGGELHDADPQAVAAFKLALEEAGITLDQLVSEGGWQKSNDGYKKEGIDNITIDTDWGSGVMLLSAVVGEKYHYINIGGAGQELAAARARIARVFDPIGMDKKSPTYEVSVDIKPEQLLDWDKPLNEQSELVRKALKNELSSSNDLAFDGNGVLLVDGEEAKGYYVNVVNAVSSPVLDALRAKKGLPPVVRPAGVVMAYVGGNGPYRYGSIDEARSYVMQEYIKRDAVSSMKDRGASIYEKLTRRLGSQAKASDYLQSLGILGHRYNASGGKNNTHPNYVIYDDSKITTNYIHFNKQAGKPGAHESWKSGPTSQDEQQKEMDAAKAWLEKVLPGTVLKFIDETGWSGEYVEAENLINISKTAAAGIMGTAYHEGLHKFFAQLVRGNPKLMAVMRDFVNDPKVLARLEELLVDYPAARDQLADGEERLAYAFQFWKAGLLAVDTKPANIFQKIGALMRRILGTMRNSEHVNAIFSAFDEGLMSEPSAAGKVIAKQLAKGTNNLVVRRKLDKLVQGLAAGVLPAEMILGNSVSASARKIGALMFTNPGDGVSGGTVGYINAKRNTSRTFDNRAKQMFESMNKVDMDAVQEFMQSETPLKDIKAQSHRDAVEGLRNLMDEFHKYMTDSGLKVGKIDNYYPTVWSLAQLHAKKSEFLKMLVNNYAEQMNPDGGNAHKAALRIWQSLVDRDGIDDLRLESKRLDAAEGKPVREDGVLSPFFAGQESRTLPWLEGQHKAAFLEKNMVGTLSAYFHQGVRATEYRRRFGENGVKLEIMLKSARSELDGASREMLAREEFKDDEARKKWVTRQMRDVSMSVGAIEGTLGKDISPNMRKFNSWMMVYQNVRLLPMALFSSFVDPLAMVARGAPMSAAFETFVHGVQSVFRAWGDSFKDLPPDRVKGKWADLAEHIGATEVAAFTHHVAEEYSSAYMSPAAKKINDFMFRFNGMEAWDRSNRIMATKWAVRFIEQHAALPDKNHSARWLAELGLTKDSIPLNADGELIVDKHELAASKGITVEQAAKEMAVVHAALNRWVEGAVITPNAAQRPAWSSDPNYSIFFHLKQFSYSFQQTIMKRAVNEIEHGNIAPVGALAMFIPTMIASDILKGLIQGGGSLPPYMAGFTAGDWALHGLNRSGLAGVGDIGMNAAMDPMSLAGPGAEQLTDAMRQPFDRTLMKAAPAHALYEYMMPATASGG